MSWLARAILYTSVVVFNASRKLPSYAVLQYAELCLSLYTWTSPPLYIWHQPAVKGHYEFLVGGVYVVSLFLRRSSNFLAVSLYGFTFDDRAQRLTNRAL